MEDKSYFSHWAAKYKSDLLDNILPFWFEHGIDRVHGGYYTCVDRDGKLYDPTKSVWFQGRFAYILAYACNHIGTRPEWLAASRSGLDFIERHCTDSDGRMFFEVAADGTPLRKRRYLFSECFAAIAMAEYSLAAGDPWYARKALDLFRLIIRYKNDPELLEPKYLPTFKAKGHSLPMILINTALVIRQVIQDPVLDCQIEESIREVTNNFLHPEFKALLETVGPDGEFIDTSIGRTINPGHSIETSWFLMEAALARGGDEALLKCALQILDWSWEWGWDKEYGGIINFRDCRGFPPQDYSQGMKFWWPQTETVIASLYAYKLTGDERYLEMHKMANEYMYTHFPDPEFGEWYGYLHRDGTVAQPAKGNIFKGPFHIPRMLIRAHCLCKELSGAKLH